MTNYTMRRWARSSHSTSSTRSSAQLRGRVETTELCAAVDRAIALALRVEVRGRRPAIDFQVAYVRNWANVSGFKFSQSGAGRIRACQPTIR